jgi:DNA modification methylase
MIGAIQAGWDEVVGIEISEEYVEIAKRRLAYYASKMPRR